eukprot:scaffold21812_cov110-Isochrysis_galbana.AAC.20
MGTPGDPADAAASTNAAAATIRRSSGVSELTRVEARMRGSAALPPHTRWASVSEPIRVEARMRGSAALPPHNGRARRCGRKQLLCTGVEGAVAGRGRIIGDDQTSASGT